MSRLPHNLYTAAQVRELDRYATEALSISGTILMERAGEATFEYLRKHWPGAKRIAVMCGTGNNAGDGFVIARLARENELDVDVWQVGDSTHLKGEALAAQQRMLGAGSAAQAYKSTGLQDYDVIVDALLGTGIQGELKSDYTAAIKQINISRVPILAVDIPSGLDADTGTSHGVVVNADVTVTFIGMKQGLVTGSGPDFCGHIYFDDLKVPLKLYTMRSPAAHCLNYFQFKHFLKPRSRVAHKGDFGHVLVVGGAPGMPGAARMAGESALRVGAGMVSIATHANHAANLNAARPELMCHAVETAADLEKLFERSTVIAIGPGLGTSEWSTQLFAAAVDSGLPLVVDADALNILAGKNRNHDEWVITPHPGEAGRLLGMAVGEIQADRFKAVELLASQFGGVAVLKGAGTLLKTADGLPAVCMHGNPGMATAGMGDVLTGTIAGLIAQGLALKTAAELGVCMHGLAGDEVAKTTGERGLLATDIIPWIRRLANPK